MTRALLFSMVFLGLMTPAEPVVAQDGLRLRVIPRFGLLAPDEVFYDQFKNFSGDGYIEWTSGSLGRAAYVGLELEAELPGFGVLLRGEVARSFEGWLTAGHGILIPRVLFEPPQVVNTWFDIPTSLTLLGLQAVLPTRLEFKGIQPYVLVGYAGKWYGFGEPSIPNEVEAILPGDGFTHSLELGGGLSIPLFGFTFDMQLKDSMNNYWDKTQNDLVFSGGLIWSVR